jgi:hypothetical protein
VDFAYIDGCHGYPFPALDWHYVDLLLKIGGTIGMDNAELRPVDDHCRFLVENRTYREVEPVIDGSVLARFFVKEAAEEREWVDQAYSRIPVVKKEAAPTFPFRVKRKLRRVLLGRE